MTLINVELDEFCESEIVDYVILNTKLFERVLEARARLVSGDLSGDRTRAVQRTAEEQLRADTEAAWRRWHEAYGTKS